MTDEIKLGRLARDLPAAEIEVRRADDGKRVTLSFPASSEAPVARWFGTEVLSHADGAVVMDRIASRAAPLLFNHDWHDPIGVIDGGRVKGGRLYVDARLFSTARAQEVATMVDEGLRNVSIGYEIDEMVEDKKRETFTATRWTPLEVSVVTVPADHSVGIGRAQDDHAKPVRVVRAADIPIAAKAAAHQGGSMSEQQTAATGANVEARQATRVEVTDDHGQRMSAMQIEQNRVEAIRNLCRANSIDQRTEADWVRGGTQLEEVAREILGIQVERQKANKTYAGSLGLSSKEQQRYSFFKAVRALHYGNRNPELIREAAFEIECSREVAKRIGKGDTVNMLVPSEILQRPIVPEQRAMATTPGASGGYLVDTQNIGFIDILRNRSVAMSMGATTLQLEGNAAFVRQTGSATVTWQAGEHTSVTATDQTLGQLSMTPKTCIAITDVSEQLLRQSSPSAEAFVMRDLASTLAVAGVDNAVINGSGGAQPLGIKSTTGVTTGQDASAASYAKILAFPSTAANSNAILSRPGFVTNAAGAVILMQKQRFSSTDTPLWDGNMFDGTLVGFRAMASEQLASANLIFGSWGEVIIGEWGVLELATDTGGTRFNAATVGIRAMWMVDVLVRYPQAFVVSTNLAAS